MTKEQKTTKDAEQKAPELKKMDRLGWWIFSIGVVLMIGLPWIFTLPLGIQFLGTNEMNNIGSSISGMTAPAIGLLSAGLVFLSFRAQITMNDRQISQFEEQRIFNGKLLTTNTLQQQQIKDQQKRLEESEKEKEYENAVKELNKVDEVITKQSDIIKNSADKLLSSTLVTSFKNYKKTGVAPHGGMIVEFQKIEKAFMLNVTPIEKLRSMTENLNLTENDLFLIYFSKSTIWRDFVGKFSEVVEFYERFIRTNMSSNQKYQLDSSAEKNIARLTQIIFFIKSLESPESK